MHFKRLAFFFFLLQIHFLNRPIIFGTLTCMYIISDLGIFSICHCNVVKSTSNNDKIYFCVHYKDICMANANFQVVSDKQNRKNRKIFLKICVNKRNNNKEFPKPFLFLNDYVFDIVHRKQNLFH